MLLYSSTSQQFREKYCTHLSAVATSYFAVFPYFQLRKIATLQDTLILYKTVCQQFVFGLFQNGFLSLVWKTATYLQRALTSTPYDTFGMNWKADCAPTFPEEWQLVYLQVNGHHFGARRSQSFVGVVFRCPHAFIVVTFSVSDSSSCVRC